MAEPVTVIPASEVEGNITSCKVENQVKSIQKESAWSFRQTSNYMTYDVCNKNVLAEYQVPEFTTFGLFMVITVPIILIITLAAIFDGGGSYYGDW